jgi:CRISPR-associated protein Csm1
MTTSATTVALAALTFWITRTRPQQAPDPLADLDAPLQDILRRTAWLVCGASLPADPAAWPDLDPQQPLESIFNRVEPRQGPALPKRFVRRASLALQEDVLFPVASDAAHTPAPDPAAALLTALQTVTQQQLAPPVRLERLLYALQRHGWCLPSPLPAVSLYDFARTHAAIAAARAIHDDTVFLLGGDLSGVQEFIYTLTADGATKQLRGRSFYLQLLTEAAAHYVLEQVHLPLTNLLYSGGGRFYLVLPGTASHRLPHLRRDLGERLLQRHGGTLYVALGGAAFREHGDSQDAWNAVNDAINADKQRRFAALDASRVYQTLFTPRQPAVSPDIADAQALVPQDDLSRSLEELAPRLHRAQYLEVQPHTPKPPAGAFTVQPVAWAHVLNEFGLSIRPVDAREVQHAQRTTRLLAILDRSEEEWDQVQVQLGTVGVPGLRYTVTVAPAATEADVADYHALGLEDDGQVLRVGNVKPFSLLVAQSRGIKRLGVLRMDVDDLGELFGQRLERAPGIAGLAYTAALSAVLSHFFEGWVGELCRRINEPDTPDRGSVYAIYSGGDDLFIVGSWHLLPGLAAALRNDFVRYTTGTPACDVAIPPITLSAGITLHSAKFPLYQAADEAHAALDAAKAHTRGPDRHHKDAISFLGQVVGWEAFSEVATLTDDLQGLLGQGAPHALLMTVQSLYQRYAEERTRHRTRGGDPQFAYGPWVWQGAYQLTRLAERTTHKEAREKIAQLRKDIISKVQAPPFIERAGLAARWAQLLVRGRKDER